MDLGAGSNGDPFSDLADSAGAGLLGLEPADLDGGGAVEEEEPRPRELFDEWPRPARRTRTRTTAPDDPQKEEVHESAQKLGKRSASICSSCRHGSWLLAMFQFTTQTTGGA